MQNNYKCMYLLSITGNNTGNWVAWFVADAK